MDLKTELVLYTIENMITKCCNIISPLKQQIPKLTMHQTIVSPPDRNSLVICCISVVEGRWNIIRFKNEILFNYIQSKIYQCCNFLIKKKGFKFKAPAFKDLVMGPSKQGR